MFISEPKAEVAVNVGLVFDGTLSPAPLKKLKAFGKDVVDGFEVSDEGARFSLMSFGSQPSLEVTFREELGAEKLKEKMDGMDGQFGVARIDKALEDAAKTMFSDENLGRRSSFPKVLVLFTTDGAQSNEKDLDEAVENLKKEGVKAMVVIVGDGLKDEVKKIAPKEEDVFRLDDFDDLPETAGPLVDRLLEKVEGKTGFACFQCMKLVAQFLYEMHSASQERQTLFLRARAFFAVFLT